MSQIISIEQKIYPRDYERHISYERTVWRVVQPLVGIAIRRSSGHFERL